MKAKNNQYQGGMEDAATASASRGPQAHQDAHVQNAANQNVAAGGTSQPMQNRGKKLDLFRLLVCGINSATSYLIRKSYLTNYSEKNSFIHK